MNLNPVTVVVSLAVLMGAVYLAGVIKRIQNHGIPFAKALNPFYTKEMKEMALLKKSLHPIVKEVETQDMARFINYWVAKFEKNAFSEKDVLELNARLEEGNSDQVNGILALHPEAKQRFDAINLELKLKAESLLKAEIEMPAESLV